MKDYNQSYKNFYCNYSELNKMSSANVTIFIEINIYLYFFYDFYLDKRNFFWNFMLEKKIYNRRN